MVREIQDARNYFRKKETEECERYSNALLRDLDRAGITGEEKDYYYSVEMQYKENSMAASIFGVKCQQKQAQLNEYIQAYNNEPNDVKANEYLKKINLLKRQLASLDEKYNYFDEKRDALRTEMLSIDKKIDNRIKKMESQKKQEPQTQKMSALR